MSTEGGIHLDPGSLVILFIIITLTIGIVCREIEKRSGFPYTPLLIIFGAFVGGVPEFGKITESTDNMLGIDPHSILILLLPLLIFESAYNAHTEVLAKNFWQVMLLVGPGVLMQTFFLSAILYYVLGYGGDGIHDMNYESTLVLGTILATTDPVAVVSLLKSLGAPLHIETLIEMESLFNDGIAMVFFQIFKKLAQGESISAGKALGDFCLMAFGGPLVGVLFGFGTLIILKVFTRGTTLFISMVVLLAYSVFLTSEKFFEGKVSGLLALVVSGIIMNVQAKDYMTNKQKAAVGMILSYLQYVSETILFFMSGVFIGDILIRNYDNSDDNDNNIQADDWWKIVVLYLFLCLGRFAMFMMFKIPLDKIGEGMSWKECYIASWGGLRGALAIALGLIVFADDPNPDGINKRTQNLILFYVCGIATLTLLLNGTTAGSLIDFLKLITNTEVKKKFKIKYLKQVKAQAELEKSILQKDSYFDMVEWKGVDELINLKELEQKQGWQDQNRFETEFKKKKHHHNGHSHNGGTLKLNSDQIALAGKVIGKLKNTLQKTQQQDEHSDEQYQRVRYEFLRIFMKMISHTKSKEWISKRVFQLIFDAAEEGTEKLCEPIQMWHLLQECIASQRKLYYLKKFLDFPFFGKLINYWFHLELEFIHEMIYIFTTCIHDTKITIKDMLSQQSRNVRKMQHQNIVLQEFDKDYYKAKEYMRKIQKEYYDVLGKLEQRKAAVKIIMAQAKMVDEHINTSYIPEKEGNEIKNYLSKKIETLQSIHILVKLSNQSESLLQLFFKDTLDDGQIDHLVNNSSTQSYEKNEFVLEKGQETNFVYFIVSGEIEEIIEDPDNNSFKSSSVTYTTGQAVGLTNLVCYADESQVTLRTKEEGTQVYMLPISELVEFYEDGKFEEFCLKKCLYQFLHLTQQDTEEWEIYGSKTFDEINRIAQDSQCIRLEAGQPIRLEYGGYLYEGYLQPQDKIDDDEGNTDGVLEECSIIPPGIYYQTLELSLLLEFKRPRQKVQLQQLQTVQQQQQLQQKQLSVPKKKMFENNMNNSRQRGAQLQVEIRQTPQQKSNQPSQPTRTRYHLNNKRFNKNKNLAENPEDNVEENFGDAYLNESQVVGIQNQKCIGDDGTVMDVSQLQNGVKPSSSSKNRGAVDIDDIQSQQENPVIVAENKYNCSHKHYIQQPLHNQTNQNQQNNTSNEKQPQLSQQQSNNQSELDGFQISQISYQQSQQYENEFQQNTANRIKRKGSKGFNKQGSGIGVRRRKSLEQEQIQVQQKQLQQLHHDEVEVVVMDRPKNNSNSNNNNNNAEGVQILSEQDELLLTQNGKRGTNEKDPIMP